jgi:hypothetical protein
MAPRGFAREPRLSYANVMSTVAMFLALGDGAVMAKQTLLNGNRIKPGTIPANRIKKHALTSTQIKLSKLGTVGNAAHASAELHLTCGEENNGQDLMGCIGVR